MHSRRPKAVRGAVSLGTVKISNARSTQTNGDNFSNAYGIINVCNVNFKSHISLDHSISSKKALFKNIKLYLKTDSTFHNVSLEKKC